MSMLKFIYDGGASKRFHTVPVHKVQNIAAHSFGVAWFCELITNGQASKNLIMAALAHDLAEHQLGDIPSPAKRSLGIGPMFHEHEANLLRQQSLNYEDTLSEGEALALKLADMMEGMMYCVTELELGNRNIIAPYNRFRKYATELMSNIPEAATGVIAESTMWTVWTQIDLQAKGLIQ